MTKTRLEAFSDAVIAIVITIMVLEFATPHGEDWEALRPLVPVILMYLLTFVFLAIYWNNHHHLIHSVKRVNGAILWANMHLLFWLSLTPFVTRWMGETGIAEVPTFAYGVVLLMAAIAYYILQGRILATHGPGSPLREALGADLKGKISPVLYAAGLGFAFVSRWVSVALYVVVALMWLVPDRRIEALFHDAATSAAHEGSPPRR